MKSTLLLLGVLFNSCGLCYLTAQPIKSTPTTPPSTTSALRVSCDNLTGRWTATDPDATMCIDVDTESDSVQAIFRNGTDPFFVWGNGNVDYPSYKHFGFSAIWPLERGVTGYAGECHKCEGTEVLMMSAVTHNINLAPGCGEAANPTLTTMYKFYRSWPPCMGLTLNVPRAPVWLLQKMGITALDPSQLTL